jgi:DNA-binding SARP family transcriptional activator
VPGCQAYEEWVAEIRQAVKQNLIEKLQQQARHFLTSSNTAKSILFSRRLITVDTLNEEGHLLLLEALYKEGQHTEALRSYGRFQEQLQQELSTRPGLQLEEFFS